MNERKNKVNHTNSNSSLYQKRSQTKNGATKVFPDADTEMNDWECTGVDAANCRATFSGDRVRQRGLDLVHPQWLTHAA
jgi:hypothetical protein